MKKILRSEMIKAEAFFIGLETLKPNMTVEEYSELKLNLFNTKWGEGQMNDFIQSYLFSNDDDIFEAKNNDDLVNHINKRGENKIVSDWTWRNGLFDEDYECGFFVFEYEEIKHYYELFKMLYEQDIYKAEREVDGLKAVLMERIDTEIKRIKI